MKILIWIAGLVLFLGFAGLALFFAPPPGHALGPTDAEDSTWVRSRVLDELRGEVDEACDGAQRMLGSELRRIETALCRADVDELRALLQRWELDTSTRDDVRAAIAAWLDGWATRTDLEFASLVTQEGEILTSRGAGKASEELTTRDSARLQLLAEPFLRDGRCSVGIELVPAPLVATPDTAAADAGPTTAGTDSPSNVTEESDKVLCLAGGKSVWVRPDAPHSLLLAGVRAGGLLERSATNWNPSASELRWHLFADPGDGPPVVVAGDRLGASVRRGLVRELLLKDVSELPGFTEVGVQVGRWRALRSGAGLLVGGWGVTVDGAYLESATRVASDVPATARGFLGSSALDLVVTTILVLAGLGVLGIFLALWARLVRPKPSAAATRAAVRATAPSGSATVVDVEALQEVAGMADTISQTRETVERVEAGFDAFLDRAEGVIQERLQSISSSPEALPTEIRDQLADLFARIDGFSADLQVARGDLGATEDDAPASAAVGPDDLERFDTRMEGVAARLGDIETRLVDFFAIVQRESNESRQEAVQAEVARLEERWRRHVDTFRREVDDALEQGKGLASALEEAHEVESALRADLAAAEEVEDKLRQKLESTHLRCEQMALQENAAVRRVHNLETNAEGDVQESTTLRREAETLRSEVERLRGELQNARSDANGSDESAQSLNADLESRTAEVQRLEEENNALREELDQSRGSVDALREERHAFGEEGARLREELATSLERAGELEQELATLRGAAATRVETLVAEKDAIAAENETLVADKETLTAERNALAEERESVAAEKESFAAENGVLEAEKEALLAERAELVARKEELAAEKDVLTMAKAELDADRARLSDELATLRASASAQPEPPSAMEVPLPHGGETAIESSDAAQDREDFLRLYDEVEQLRQDKESERAAHEQLASEREELLRRVRELEDTLRDSEAQAGTTAAVVGASCGVDASGDAARHGSAQALEQELADLREEIEGVQGFQGALIAGNLPTAVGAVDTNLKVFVWNPAAESFWGVPAPQALGESLREVGLSPHDLHATLLAELDAVIASGQPRKTRIASYATADEGELFVRLWLEPVLDVDAAVAGVIFSVEDLTLVTERDVELRLQTQFQDSLTSSIPMGLVVTDPTFRVVSWNRHAAAIFGVDENDALDANLLELTGPYSRDGFESALRLAAECGLPGRFVVHEADNDDIVVTLAPFCTESGKGRGWLLLLEVLLEEEVV